MRLMYARRVQQGRAEKAGKRKMSMAPYKICKRESRTRQLLPSVPILYVSKAASSAWHCTASGSLVALPFTLMAFFFLCFLWLPLPGACVSMRRLVSIVHACNSEQHRHGGRPVVSHQCCAATPAESKRCLDMFFCVFLIGLEC